MKQELNNLNTQIENLENLIQSNPDENYDEKFYELEDKFDQIKDFQYSEIDYNFLKKVQKRLRSLRNDLDLYDENGEREAMFPNGEDE